MSRTTTGRITPEQQAAHGSLMSIIAGHIRNGQRVPCTDRNRDCWTSSDPEHALFAAMQCGACPLIESCRAYVNTWPEKAGVWAGTLPTERENT